MLNGNDFHITVALPRNISIFAVMVNGCLPIPFGRGFGVILAELVDDEEVEATAGDGESLKLFFFSTSHFVDFSAFI